MFFKNFCDDGVSSVKVDINNEHYFTYKQRWLKLEMSKRNITHSMSQLHRFSWKCNKGSLLK